MKLPHDVFNVLSVWANAYVQEKSYLCCSWFRDFGVGLLAVSRVVPRFSPNDSRTNLFSSVHADPLFVRQKTQAMARSTTVRGYTTRNFRQHFLLRP